MIYSFYFEGGNMDGEVVLTDFAARNGSPPRSAAWIDFTLGGAVGLSFPVGDAKAVGLSGTAAFSKAGERDGSQQVYQVVYRDQNADGVIVRCRYLPMLELIPPGVKRIIFAFEGGFRDGSTDECTIVPSDKTLESAGSRARYLMTESGTIGKRFGAGSDTALKMLKDDGPEATRNTGAMLQIYGIASRIRDGDDLRLKCRFIRTE
jgi:hypothetical protein